MILPGEMKKYMDTVKKLLMYDSSEEEINKHIIYNVMYVLNNNITYKEIELLKFILDLNEGQVKKYINNINITSVDNSVYVNIIENCKKKGIYDENKSKIENVIIGNENALKDIIAYCVEFSESYTDERFQKFQEDTKNKNEALFKVELNVDEIKKWLDDNLFNLIGLQNVKDEIKSLVNQAIVQKKREELNLNVINSTKHLIFTGNPGTGKTTIARLLAQVYKKLGIISKGQLIEVSRNDLVAGYTGQTAIKVKDVVDSAKGGILFIDEAYSLSDSNDSYGQEAIDTLLKLMEDYRNDLVVIVAGYKDEMNKFISSNPGLLSRFKKEILFEDYSLEELILIFESMIISNQYYITENVKKEVEEIFKNQLINKQKDFGNARFVRNYFEKVVSNQSNRIVDMKNASEQDMKTIKIEDLNL